MIHREFLDTPIEYLKGVGPKRAELLRKELNIDTFGDLLQYYPNTLIPRLRGEDNAGYYAAFRYAVLADQEGVLRFPNASQALQWQFGLAYSLARIGQGQAGEVYAELLAGALNEVPLPPQFQHALFTRIVQELLGKEGVALGLFLEQGQQRIVRGAAKDRFSLLAQRCRRDGNLGRSPPGGPPWTIPPAARCPPWACTAASAAFRRSMRASSRSMATGV